MKLTDMKISPNSPLTPSSFSLSRQRGLTVSTKLTGVISVHSGALCYGHSLQIGVKKAFTYNSQF